MTELSRRTVIIATCGASVALAAPMLVKDRLVSGPPGTSLVRTSFGRVALLGSTRLTPASTGARVVAHAAHPHHVSGALVASAVHGAWTEAVLVQVAVHNGMRRAMELSPGQFRVRVGGTGPTVSLYSADRDAGPVEPGSTTTMLIRYLAPGPDHPLSLEFQDTDAARPVGLGRIGLPYGVGHTS